MPATVTMPEEKAKLPIRNGTFIAILSRQMDFAYASTHGELPIQNVFYDSYAEYSPQDSKLWSQLWGSAYTNADVVLCNAINLARAGGAKLMPSKKYGYMIKPDYENKNCYWSPEDYADIQAVFRAYEDKLLELLKKLTTPAFA